MQVIDVSKPIFFNYLVRVGGVGAIFAISILTTTEFFPGYEGYVVLAISGLGICYFVAKEILGKNNRAKKRC